MMNLSGKSVVVVGLGRSGIAAARLCLQKGARVVATDAMAPEKASQAILALEAEGARLILGGHHDVPWDSCDLVVVSPGVPSFRQLEDVQRSGREVIGELELACRFVSAPIVLIGGTNGKSTVTSLVGQMLSEKGARRVFVGGNLGIPLCEQLGGSFDFVVLEISSFQAERIPTLHPRAAALLNVTDDHLDRYESFDAYAAAKGNMFVHMDAADFAIIPAGDPICEKQARRGHGRVITFGPDADVRPEGDFFIDSVRGYRFAKNEMRLSGKHNELNACAAIALCASLGASQESIAHTLSTFGGLPHRTVLVQELDGIRYYDDSKGTNVGATVAALCGLCEPKAVLIAGGRDKQGSYAPLVQTLKERGRALVVIGEAAERIAQAAQGVLPTVHASSMDEAVLVAKGLAKPGDAVLLSPACSSYDMFKDYKARGEAFCQAVRQLGQGIAQ